jgi:hypothetical protein
MPKYSASCQCECALSRPNSGTLSALLRDGPIDPAARRELQIRPRSLRTGDNQQWTGF